MDRRVRFSIIGANKTHDEREKEETKMEKARKRYKQVTPEELDKIENERDDENIKKVTKWAVTILREYLMSKGRDAELDLSAAELNTVLREFYASVQTQTGKHYSVKSLIAIRASFKRFFTRFNIMEGPEFKSSNAVFSSVIKRLRKSKKDTGCRHPKISEADIKIIYSSDVLSCDSPAGLVRKVWWDIQLCFARRGRGGNRDLSRSSFVVLQDDDGVEYVSLAHNQQTKNPSNPDETQKESLLGFMFAMPGDPRCPVASFKKYLSKCPEDAKAFYLHPKRSGDVQSQPIWYSKEPMGVNTLGNMLKRICEEVRVSAPLSRIYTNHSLRRTTVGRLSGANIAQGKRSDDPPHPDSVPSFTSPAERIQAVNNLERHHQSQNEFLNGFHSRNTECASVPPVPKQEADADIKTETGVEAIGVKLEETHHDISSLHQSPVPKEGADADIKTETRVQLIQVKIEETHDDVASLHQQIHFLNTECQTLRDRVHELENELKLCSLDASQFNDDKMRFFTGLPNLQTFMLLLSYVSSVFPVTANQSLKHTQELLLTLMKLRLNLSEEFLGFLFGIDQSTVSGVFQRWIHVMASRLHPLIPWPEREDVRHSLPTCFQTDFQNCVSILDCFEVFIERPSDPEARAQTWSNNKQHNTTKFLISVTPQGSISFVSKAWGGHVTDKHLTEQSLFLDKLQTGDLVLANRGFMNEDSVGLCCAEVVTPPFSQGMKQFDQKDIKSAGEISDVRTHVERATGMLRQKYTILSSTLPASLIRVKQNGRVEDNLIDEIVFTCCALCNLSESKVCFIKSEH